MFNQSSLTSSKTFRNVLQVPATEFLAFASTLYRLQMLCKTEYSSLFRGIRSTALF